MAHPPPLHSNPKCAENGWLCEIFCHDPQKRTVVLFWYPLSAVVIIGPEPPPKEIRMSADYTVQGDLAVITMNNPPINGLGLNTRQAIVAGL